MSMMTIDGSQGEGGGQIVRSSMALSVLSATPIHITNIRAGRKKPGLKRQHGTSVCAVAEICAGSAVLDGAELESSELVFEPGSAQPGTYYFSVGSAGSATLVLQTVLPVLLRAGGPSTVVVEGGTHNAMAPPFDFLDRCFLPWVRKMGATVDLTLDQHGFYPAGGGKIVAHIVPATHLAGFELLDRGKRTFRRAHAVLSKLPDSIGERQLKTVTRLLGWPPETDAELVRVQSPGPGTLCHVELGFDHVTELITGFGRRGITSERVGKAVADEVSAYLEHGAPVGEQLADQLLMPLALSACEPADAPIRRGGVFRTGPLSMHTTTHIDILQRFLPVHITTTPDDDSFIVAVRPASF